MALLQVVASRPLAGKTAIAATLAKGLADYGRVRLVRTGAGLSADADAETFNAYLFASTSGKPVAADALAGFPEGEVMIVEADAAGVPLNNAAVVLVVRRELSDADTALVASLGDRLLGSIATDVPPASVEDVARALTNAGLHPLAIVPEDRRLAAPSVGEIRVILNARLLHDGENELEVVEDVLLSPIYADPAQPHFRRFASKAVLAPFHKTDLHLAAIETQAACLVITGGRDPSPYVLDRAQGESTTVILAASETAETLSSLGNVWLTSRFRGERKLDAAFSHVEGRIDFPGLLRKLGV